MSQNILKECEVKMSITYVTLLRVHDSPAINLELLSVRRCLLCRNKKGKTGVMHILLDVFQHYEVSVWI